MKTIRLVRVLSVFVCVVSLAVGVGATGATPKSAGKSGKPRPSAQADLVNGLKEGFMSGPGRLAHMSLDGRLDKIVQRAKSKSGGRSVQGGYVDPGEDEEGPAGGQAETAIAVDVTGQKLVAGTNDSNGFNLVPYRLSGYSYSTDGGATFTYGNQLPITTGTSTAYSSTGAATTLPQIYGDPDVKYVPGGAGCQFIYASIGVVPTLNNYSTPTAVPAQSMVIHRSIDCGQTWTGPFEVTAATNPHGAFSPTGTHYGQPVDAADKEFIDVDPDTGRVVISWTNFTSSTYAASGTEIRTAYCDNIMSATPPTWSAGVVIDPGDAFSASGSMPRFAGNGSSNVYVVYNRYSGTGTTYGGWPYQNEYFSRSTDNGVTWAAPIALRASDFFPIDQIPGNDRVHQFPGMAVDTTSGPYSGYVYVAYADNTNRDGADVAFQRSTDGGLTFSAFRLLNSRPGSDRAQWFPYVAVDQTTGRVNVIYYDQGIAASGDMTELTWIYSDDGGSTWSKPSPMNPRPFRGGFGNDTGQPNLGDYNGVVARGGNAWGVWGGTPPLVLFQDGLPAGSMTVPDLYYAKTTAALPALNLGTVIATDTTGNNNGYIDPGEQIHLKLPLVNYVTNAGIGTTTYTGVSGTLTTSTANVSIYPGAGTQSYANVASGATMTNATDFVIVLGTAFTAGSKIDLSLAVTTAQGSKTFPFTLDTGTPTPTLQLSDNLASVTPPALPAGWTAVHQGGNTNLWVTSTLVGPGATGFYHANTTNQTNWERLFSPNFSVPAGAQNVTLDFDIVTKTEDDPDFNVLTYDGVTLRIYDVAGGRSVLAEAFADKLTYGSGYHFPKHNYRYTSNSYFQDMSLWGGDSGGVKHVHMSLPGMAGLQAQLRFDFTQDTGDCTGPGVMSLPCGVWIGNLSVNSVTYAAAPIVQADVSVTANAPSTTTPTTGSNVTYVFPVTNIGTSAATSVVFTDTLPANLTRVSCAATGGGVCGGSGNNVQVTFASLASGATANVTIVATVNCNVADGTVIANGASITSAVTDPNPLNNTVSAANITAANPAPVFTPNPPPDVHAPIVGSSGAVLYTLPSVSDNCPGTVVNCLPVSGSVFPAGVTVVNCTAVDAAGRTTLASFNVNADSTLVTIPTLSTWGLMGLGGILALAGLLLLRHLGTR